MRVRKKRKIKKISKTKLKKIVVILENDGSSTTAPSQFIDYNNDYSNDYLIEI